VRLIMSLYSAPGNAAGRGARKEVSRASPCDVCAATDGCSRGEDGLLFCRKWAGEHPGFVYLGQAKGDPQWGMYRVEGEPRLNGHGKTAARADTPRHSADWTARARVYAQALTPERAAELAAALGLPQAALAVLPLLGFHPDPEEPCWTFPEV